MSENLEKALENSDEIIDELESADEQGAGEAQELTEEESTIFSAPQEHKDKAHKAKGGNTKRIVAIIATCLAVVTLVVGTLHIINNIDILKDDEVPANSNMFEDITVVETDSSIFETVTITNKNGEFKFVKKQIETTDEDGKTQTTEYWTIDGIDQAKLSSLTLDDKINSASKFVAFAEVDKLSVAECGLDKPTLKISVVPKEGKNENAKPFTVLVGKKSPDGNSSYLKLDGDSQIYLVNNSYFEDFDFTLLDLTDRTSIPATTFTVDTTENKAADGTYAYFDSLKISGELFPDMITIMNNKEENETATIVMYLTTTPTERYVNAEKLDPFLSIFSSELPVAGCYSLDVTDAAVKELGLDKPDAVITLTIGGEPKTFKFKKVDNEYAAVLYDGATMIKKISLSNLTLFDIKPEDIYMENIFLYSVNDLNSVEFKDSEHNIKFDISYEENEEGQKTYHFKNGGKELVTSTFQDFYSALVGVQCNDFSINDVSSMQPTGTITFKFKDNTTSVVEFYGVDVGSYQYSINGKQMGKIPASYYNSTVVDGFVKTAEAYPQ